VRGVVERGREIEGKWWRGRRGRELQPGHPGVRRVRRRGRRCEVVARKDMVEVVGEGGRRRLNSARTRVGGEGRIKEEQNDLSGFLETL
jgi:hypothetical protein